MWADSLRLHKYSLLFQLLLPIFSICWWFSNSIMPSTFTSLNSTLSKRFLLSSIYLHQQRLIGFYYRYWATIPYYNYLFKTSNYPRFHQWEPLQAELCVLLVGLLSSLKTSLFSGTKRYFRIILCFLCLYTGINHFSKELWFLLVENST